MHQTPSHMKAGNGTKKSVAVIIPIRHLSVFSNGNFSVLIGSSFNWVIDGFYLKPLEVLKMANVGRVWAVNFVHNT